MRRSMKRKIFCWITLHCSQKIPCKLSAIELMKTSLALLLLAVNIASADPYAIALQQAKRVSDSNTAQQQRIHQQSGTAPAAPGTPSVDPLFVAAAQNVANLQADI